MFYNVAIAFFLAVMTLGIIRLVRYIHALDAQRKAQPPEYGPTRIKLNISVSSLYTSYKASSGVLEAYQAGLAFRVADELYTASGAILASIRRDQAEMPLVVRQCILEELRWEDK